jgi:hypothetical protein
MTFFRKRTKFRSFAAICAAYAVILHAFFGGIVLSQNASAADFAFVICQGSGTAGDASHDNGQTPAKHLSCVLHCASHAAGTVPQALPEIVAQFAPSAAVPRPAAAEASRSDEHTPKLAQAPPTNV